MRLASLTAGLLAFAGGGIASATVSITIQPKTAAGTTAVWTVTSTGLSGHFADLSDTIDGMDPATGGVAATDPWGTVGYVAWIGVGDAFNTVYANNDAGQTRAFGNGVSGVTSSPTQFGVGPDDDGPSAGDDLLIMQTNRTVGVDDTFSFTLEVPVAAGGFTAGYNPGVYTNNPNITITVTTTPVPEPSSALMLTLGAVGMAMRRRRK